MILTDREIQAAISTGQIIITPLPETVAYSSTSLDLTLASRVHTWKVPTGGVDITLDPSADEFKFSEVFREYAPPTDMVEYFLLKPKTFALAWTKEDVTLPPHSRIAARVEGKSSLARLGVGIHVTAPTIHAGFAGQIQLEVFNHGVLPVKLRPGMRICQLIFEQTLGTPDKGYQGMFRGQKSN